jgi:putative membrane protein
MSNLSKRLPLGLAVAALALCFAAARADKDSKEPEPITDTDFLAQAATSGNAEVKLSELATKQAGDDKVKTFAQKLVKEHTALNDKLADAGRGLKFGVVLALEKETKATYDRLSKLQGAEFDREYLKQMIDDHEKAVTLFEREAKTGTNADVKKFAGDNLAKIKEHLKEARDLRDGLKEKK